MHITANALDAVDFLQSSIDTCIVFPVPADADVDALTRFLQLRSQYPNVPVIALYSASRSSCRATLQLGAAGVGQIVNAEPMVRAGDLQTALVRCHGDGIAIRLWRHCDFELPERLIPVLKAALRLAHQPLTVDRLGSATGMHQRTLRKYCAQEGLPSPQWIIGWARLLVAGYYLDEPGRTVAQVAEVLAFPSACALRNQLRRYSSVASRALRAAGTARMLARAMEQAVAGSVALAAARFRGPSHNADP